ncbi:MAG: hypothetical protein Q7T18_04320 [Sedimentisphaerales bacterium]|nr:hypothetical protein [Sedimentisphaerales bacterium]
MGDVMRGCLWAAAVMAPTAFAGLVVIRYVTSRNRVIPVNIFSAGAIRLLLSLIGSVIILRFVAVPVVWFVAWLGIFYFVVLVAEVYVAIWAMSRHKK